MQEGSPRITPQDHPVKLNIPLFITAFIGNALIIVALQKPSPLHPASKLLFGCLATTDLCISLIKQPLFVTYLMSEEHSKRCYYVEILSIITGGILIGVSLLTLTVLGLRYRHVVNLRRVRVVVGASWLSNTAIAVTILCKPRISAPFTGVKVFFCAVISPFCHTKIYGKLRHHQATARYRKTVSSALWVQMTLVACFLPYGIVVAKLAISGPGTPSLALAWAFTLSLLYLNPSLNPFLYCWGIREVRQAVKETIRQVWCFRS